jgi:hypothetical protein
MDWVSQEEYQSEDDEHKGWFRDAGGRKTLRVSQTLRVCATANSLRTTH